VIKKTRTQDVHNKREDGYYYVNICKHDHENNLTRLWCNIMRKIDVEHTKGNDGSYSYLYYPPYH